MSAFEPQKALLDRRDRFMVFAAAAALTLLNASKPLHVDDVIWWYFARHIADHLATPFDFTIVWHQDPQPAQNVMSPPLLPYWWAMAMKLGANHPVLWKLSLFPINLLLSHSVLALSKRLAPVFAVSILGMIVLSPIVLPAENLMLDIPCLAFVLAGLATAFKAFERKSLALAVVAGVLVGLATLTKWSALSATGSLALQALLFAPRRRWAVLIPGVALTVFVTWEVFLFFTAGESHFLHNLGQSHSTEGVGVFLMALGLTVGAVAPAVPLIFGLGRSWSFARMLAICGVFAIGYALVAMLPVGFANSITGRTVRNETLVFAALGFLVWGSVAATCLQSVRALWQRTDSEITARLFLLGWLANELAAYFVLSPFAASRRLIFVVVALTFLVAHSASRALLESAESHRGERLASASPRWRTMLATSFAVAIGLLFFFTDTYAAFQPKLAVERAQTWIRQRDAQSPIWFSGGHGFEFYATFSGMKPACANYSQLQAGDWLVVDKGAAWLEEKSPVARWAGDTLQVAHSFELAEGFPLTTYPAYYMGRRPIERQLGARSQITIYRLTADSALDDSSLVTQK